MLLPCYRMGLSTYLVRLRVFQHLVYMPHRRHLDAITDKYIRRQGHCQNREGPRRGLCRSCGACRAGLLSEKLAPYPVNVQVSFEFKNRKAMPVLSGIVIASEHEALILEVREIDVS